MNAAQRLAVEFERRVIVDLLAAERGHGHNVHVLSDALARFGRDVPAGDVVAHANWLAEAGLVTIVRRDPPMVLRIAARGEHVASGRIAVDGVADRPVTY